MADTPNLLDLIEAETRELVKEPLKSKAALVARLYPLITQTHQAGYAHRTIFERMARAGYEVSFGTYDTYLYRAKQAFLAGKRGSHEPTEPRKGSEIGSYEPRAAVSRAEVPSPAAPPTPDAATSATGAVVNALEQAKGVGERDYSQVIRKLKRSARAK